MEPNRIANFTTLDQTIAPRREHLAAVSSDREDKFPFLELPRELRDQIYDYAFSIPDNRGDRALRIERRHLIYFTPSAASILLLLHHEYFLLNRQVAREALERLFKNHTAFLSCGLYVLKQFLASIEATGGPGKQWLKRMRKIELNWVTFPNLRNYPPERSDGKDVWWWENDGQEVDVDYIRGAQYNGHYDEHDYEGGYYDDNFYEAENTSLYPSWPLRNAAAAASNDPFGFTNHYPFADPSRRLSRDASRTNDLDTKLDLLVSLEVAPFYDYLSSPTFALSSITVPLYFISGASLRSRSNTRVGKLPIKIRYWVHNCIHALLMLHNSSTLQEVCVKYAPWDTWASMEPADDLHRMVKKGVWFRDSDDLYAEREGEGEAFRAVWAGLEDMGACRGDERLGLAADVRFVKWDGHMERVGDALLVVFTKEVAG
ncbi:uncharacterized protein N0V89_011415 [Didymosphaeria variabile]|uniref:Uncharacterized protein n=1 Tax=Didymosphaeria variabile TaxID=1932322 RepID=A0A9W9C5C3_9PLEO|nr:uncharacterized protein N0V89_011415 [Didymosphaeria variabile]KAJ4345285.1 hypothetical protein N0V89_011415 [Didymosphaeria variabile]